SVEHTAIARVFGVRNNYVTDQSQELTYYGVANFFNSFFHSMGIGGAMSRTAVNSACNVKSPLSGFVTTAVVLVSIFKLVGTLYWIPKSTLAAIIITAVRPLISPPSVFYRYWKTSLADFVPAMIAFWVSLFVSTEAGIGAFVGFNIVYVLLRQVFARVSTSSTADPRSELQVALVEARNLPPSDTPLPSDIRIFRFNESIFFPNAYRAKTSVLDTLQTRHAPGYQSVLSPEAAERNWSVTGEKRIAKLRRKAGIDDPSALPPVGLVIIDFSKTNHVDATACKHMQSLVREVQMFAGYAVEIRLAGMSGYVRQRFERAGWLVLDGNEEVPEGRDEERNGEAEVMRLYPTVVSALLAPRNLQRGGRSDSGKDSERERAMMR
ncbi:sulfate transporter family-domain-containing protein, partial [Lasiosphaeria ovina]